MICLDIIFGISALFCVGAGIAMIATTPENIGKYERFARAKLLGMIAAWVALFMCVPHAAVVLPPDWHMLLYPTAIIAPILCYFFLDYLTARAISGLMILFAYEIIHTAFVNHACFAAAVSCGAWILGGAAVAFSGRPCWFRDWFRWCAKRKKIAISVAVLLWIYSLLLIVSAISTHLFQAK